MEPLLLSNLAKTQAFDAALKSSNQFDRLSRQYLGAVLFEPEPSKRTKSLDELQGKIVDYFGRQVQPEARKVAKANARAVIADLEAKGVRPDLNDPEFRRRVLLDDKLRPADRLRIFQTIVNDKANTLNNRLAAYWLEPGTSPRQKLDRLKELHAQEEARRAAYEDAIRAFHAGKGTRPRAPTFDYMARFTKEVKSGAMEQARRAGTEAETAEFVSSGHSRLTWVTVNASEACPTCRKRQGLTGDLAFWEQTGRPGFGGTECGSRCFCLLVPAPALDVAPQLKQGLNAPAAREAPPATPKPPPPFPEKASEIAGMKVVRKLGGSTGAELVEDDHGQRFVRKRGANAGHLREEFAAEEAYRALGVDVPDSRLYEDAKGPVKLSKFVDDAKPLAELKGAARKAADAKLREGFVADALLGDWDAVGLAADNVLVDKGGRVWRVDVGGSLRYRAQGTLKTPAQWNGYPVDLWTLRDPKVNPQMAAVHGPLTHAEVVGQIERAAAAREAVLRALPAELRDVVGRRFDEAARVARTSRAMLADHWKDAYVGQFARHQVGIRAAGIVDKLPKRLTQEQDGSVKVVDEHGKPFDDLRGPNTIVRDVAAYVKSAGGDWTVVEEWAPAQAGTSWSNQSRALKAFLAESRTASEANYYWSSGGHELARTHLKTQRAKYGSEVYDASMTAQHAFTYELLQSVDFANNDRARGVVRLVRTESRAVMKLYNANRGDRGVRMVRGAAESYSVFKPVTVHGTEQLIADVPHFRVFGTYLHSRDADTGYTSMFAGDGENEFVAMGEGLASDYLIMPPPKAGQVGIDGPPIGNGP